MERKKRELKAKEISSDKNQNLISYVAEEVEKKEKMRLKKMIML